MKSCKGCKYADWARTKSGKLHPSGDGECTFEYVLPPLPACRSWRMHTGDRDRGPQPGGTYISRREEHKGHCPYWAREEKS